MHMLSNAAETPGNNAIQNGQYYPFVEQVYEICIGMIHIK